MRSKIYKKILICLAIFLVLFLVVAYFIGLQGKSHSVKLQESDQNPAVQNSKTDYFVKNISDFEKVNSQNNSSQKENFIQKQQTETSQKNIDEKLIEVSLKVQDKTYTIKIKEGSSAYDLMNQLKTDGLAFSATNYSSLGFFITEINGIKEDRKTKTYWTLYINGKEATVGASQLILKNSDSVEWKYENRNNY